MSWGEQFGLTEEEKGKEKQRETVTQNVLSTVNSYKVKLLVSSPSLGSGNSHKKTFRTSNR